MEMDEDTGGIDGIDDLDTAVKLSGYLSDLYAVSRLSIHGSTLRF